MADQESRRSVLPNGGLIDSLRKRKGWTIEALALESDLGMRTVQNAIAGRPVSIETLQIIADKLEAPYATLLHSAEASDAPEMLTLNIQIAVGAADTQKISEIVAFLQKFLPDNAGLCVLAVASGSVLIGVTKSEANEALLADAGLQEVMNLLGIEGFSVGREQSPVKVWFLDSAHTTNYLNDARQKYEEKGQGKPWNELSEREQDECYATYLRVIADGFWKNHKQEFQELLDEMQIDHRPANFKAQYQWCHDYLHNRLSSEHPIDESHMQVPNAEGSSYRKRFLLLTSFMTYINYLDGAYKYEIIRDLHQPG